MAPSIGRKGNQLPDKTRLPRPLAGDVALAAAGDKAMPAEAREMFQALAAMQAEALRDSRWVGDSFAEESRAIHYGERDAEAIHGQATLEEAKALLDEGIAVAPLPFPVVPPGKAN